MSKIERIAVIGAGLMGHGIAQIFASQGYAVTLMDLDQPLLDDALKRIRSNLTLMAERGLGLSEGIDPALSRIRITVEMAESVDGVQFVIEAVSENLDLKKRVFKDLDTLSPADSILATNTSVISIT
jgi:3-hydroxyacyl-CoA dehydrogenase